MADIQSFITNYLPAATQVGQQLGVAPNVILGQWGLESGWGKSVIPGTNNPGNIKDFSGNGVAATDNQTGTTDNYQQFSNTNDFANNFSNLISSKWQGATGAGTDAAAYATGLKPGQQGGYAQDTNYVPKIINAAQTAQNGIVQSIGNQIFNYVNQGHPVSDIINGLSQSPTVGADVQNAVKQGVDPMTIIGKFSPKSVQLINARATTQANSGVTNFVQGAQNAGSNVLNAGSQLIDRVTGNDAGLAADQQAAADAQNDPNNIANSESLGGTLGGVAVQAVPSIVAGALTGGAGIVPEIAAQGAAGALTGALTPTTGDGQILPNVVGGAVGGAAGGAVAGAVGGAPSVLTKTMGALTPGPSAEMAPAIAALAKEGITPTSAMVSPIATFAGNTADKVVGSNIVANVLGGQTTNDAKAAFNQKLQAAIARRAGVTTGDAAQNLSTDTIAAANNVTDGLYSNALDNVQVNIPAEQQPGIIATMQQQINSADPLIKTQLTAQFGPEIQSLQTNGTMSARGLNQLKSNVTTDAQNPGLTAAQSSAYQATANQLGSTLQSGLNPEQQQAYQQASDQYKNTLMLKQIVQKMKDNPDSNVYNALKSAVSGAGNKQQFINGTAPMQDLYNNLKGLNFGTGRTIADAGMNIGEITNMIFTHGLSALTALPAGVILKYVNSPISDAVLNPAAKAGLIQQATKALIGGALGSMGTQAGIPAPQVQPTQTINPASLAQALQAKRAAGVGV